MQLNLKSFLGAAAIAATLLLPSVNADAKPAKPGLVNLQQPDGTTISATLVGDEHGHYVVSADGYALIEGNDGFHYYAKAEAGVLTSTGVRATDAIKRSAQVNTMLAGIDKDATLALAQQRSADNATAKRSAAKGPGLYNTQGFPALGTPRGLVILVEFIDLHFSTPNVREYFYRELNEKGFSDNGHEGSARDWFIYNSFGKFEPTFDVVGPVKLSKSYTYYGKNGAYGGDINAGEMIKEACRLIDPQVDFSLYDNNGDGTVENVYVYYAGLGEADGGGADTVWPHQADLYSATGQPYDSDEDVIVNNYGTSCEIDNSTKKADGIGTFVHEFSHVLGLPDLYTTDYTSKAFTPLNWNILDVGAYNGNGCLPPYYSSFERYALDWVTPLEMTSANYTLRPLIESNDCYIIRNPENSNEYYLFENRQQRGNDRLLPGHGMLIWHVDYQPLIWKTNQVNNTATHQYVDLIEADNLRTSQSLKNDAFPGGKNITSFTEETLPKLQWWNQKPMGMGITNIEESSWGQIKFTFTKDGEEPAELYRTSFSTTELDNLTSEGFTHGEANFKITNMDVNDHGLFFSGNSEMTITLNDGFLMENVTLDLYEPMTGGPISAGDFRKPADIRFITVETSPAATIKYDGLQVYIIPNQALKSITIRGAGSDEFTSTIAKIHIGDYKDTNSIEGVEDGCIPQVTVVGGTLVMPTGSRVFTLDGRECGANDLNQGIYVVVLPDGKSEKILVK